MSALSVFVCVCLFVCVCVCLCLCLSLSLFSFSLSLCLRADPGFFNCWLSCIVAFVFSVCTAGRSEAAAAWDAKQTGECARRKGARNQRGQSVRIYFSILLVAAQRLSFDGTKKEAAMTSASSITHTHTHARALSFSCPFHVLLLCVHV